MNNKELNEPKIKSFKDLKVWQESHNLTIQVYRMTKSFPKDERYGITSQLRRCSSSVPANISEGMGMYSTKELIRFLITSRGSNEETKYFLLLAKDLEYLDEETYDNMISSANKTGKMLNSFIKKLENK